MKLAFFFAFLLLSFSASAAQRSKSSNLGAKKERLVKEVLLLLILNAQAQRKHAKLLSANQLYDTAKRITLAAEPIPAKLLAKAASKKEKFIVHTGKKTFFITRQPAHKK